MSLWNYRIRFWRTSWTSTRSEEWADMGAELYEINKDLHPCEGQAVEKISTALFSLKFTSPHFIIEKSPLKEGVFLMFHTRNSSQHEAEFVLLDQLVEEDHLLRKIDQYIDFSFIVDKVRPYYSENKGRPSLDPLILFKMMFIGYLYGIRSERQLEKKFTITWRIDGFRFEHQ